MQASVQIRLPSHIRSPILTLDPGKTTGVALLTHVYRTEYDLQTFTLAWPDDAERLETLLREANTVVYENFRLWQRKALSLSGSELMPVQVIGFIVGVARQHQQVFDQPASIQNISTDKVVLKVFPVPGNRHERSALRHLHYFLIRSAQNA